MCYIGFGNGAANFPWALTNNYIPYYDSATDSLKDSPLLLGAGSVSLGDSELFNFSSLSRIVGTDIAQLYIYTLSPLLWIEGDNEVLIKSVTESVTTEGFVSIVDKTDDYYLKSLDGTFTALQVYGAGSRFSIRSPVLGVSASVCGQATLVGGTVTVNGLNLTTDSKIFLTVAAMGTVLISTAVRVANLGAGQFDIVSADPTDTSIINWFILENTV